ncbi:protein NipSnap homolog 3A-like isoform X3 [Amblyraja radiata]|uniref:protein NipSnap homolog 3A-like isoform X3 n=1 Tax=Amblyraja radiata TaxID=386614 RepID=UPI0014038D59|nr:protein NipSnap homolog 3A-like isoform X3 [Amblyraja radiata]
MLGLGSKLGQVRVAAARCVFPGLQDKLLQVTYGGASQQLRLSSNGARPAARSISWESRRWLHRSVGTSTGPQQEHGTFYEFRTYNIKPGKMADFLNLTEDKIHLRTAISELVGYWFLEFGNMNEVFHIWKYGSYKERTAVRRSLMQEKDWQQNYISKMMPMLNHQISEVTYLVPWAQMHTSSKPVHALWWHEDCDARAAGRHRAHEDVRVVAAVRDSVNYLVSQNNKLLVPTPFSPLQ